MKIISCNVNGIRAAKRKGFFDWMREQDADIVCLQEIKISQDALVDDIRCIPGYHSFFNHAEKRGYAGVAVYTKEEPSYVKDIIGIQRFDGEGRMLEIHFEHCILLNVYIPHGHRDKRNLSYKMEVYVHLVSYVQKLQKKKPVILVGDFNIAHTEKDVARAKENKNNIMFTGEERQFEWTHEKSQ
jgi:exodeoxyribonuclease III